MIDFIKAGWAMPKKLIGKIQEGNLTDIVIGWHTKPFILAIYLPPFMFVYKQK